MFIFGNREMVKSPTDQNFIWVAEYTDGTYLAEYDLLTHKSNSFYDIDRTKIIKFGLLGDGSQVYFDVGNGVFTINNHRIMISYETNGKDYPLTGRALVYNDIITFKDAVSDANALFGRKKGLFTNKIIRYNVGYKKKMEIDDVNISFQCIAGIPLDDAAFFHIKITSDKDLNGHLVIRRNGKIVDLLQAPLKAGYSGQAYWTIK